MDKTKIRIGVVADVVCPWCYIGKRRLENAMNMTADRFDFQVEYFPFELNPHMPEEGADFRQYLCRKYGSESKFFELTAHVKKIAASEGLHFNLEAQHTSPNTRDIHRVILLAREHGRQLQAVEAFFQAYFVDAIDLTRTDNLIQIGKDAGLEAETVELLLNSNTGKVEIEMAEKELHDLGITAVPLFIVNNRLAISGAQPVETFAKAFVEAGEWATIARQ